MLYRHEPGAVIARPNFPGFCALAEVPSYADEMRRYVARLTAVRYVKASGIRPIFAKSYQRFPAALIRRMLAAGLRAGEAALVSRLGQSAFPFPISSPVMRRASPASLNRSA